MVEIEEVLKKWRYWKMLDDEAREELVSLFEKLLEEVTEKYGKPAKAYGYPKKQGEGIIPHTHGSNGMPVILPQNDKISFQTGEQGFDPKAFVKWMNRKTTEHQLPLDEDEE